MWWEILPSATIITVAMGIPALATRTINRAIHDGNPTRRNYTQQEPHGVLYHYRDTQHSKPSFWHNNIKSSTSKTNMAIHAARGKLMGVIGDEDTCVGFLLGGVGELNKNRQPNFLVVDKNTAVSDIEETLKTFIRREDISIILINQNVAEMVRHVLDAHTAPVPAVLEIPSKDSPYDPNKDSILRRAKGLFSADDLK